MRLSALVAALVLAGSSSTALAAPRGAVKPRPVTLSAADADRLAARAFDAIDAEPDGFGLPGGSWDVEVARIHADALAQARHVRVQQYVDDVPVFEGEGIVHFGADGRLRGVTDAFLRDVADVDTEPSLSWIDAADIAMAESGLRRPEIGDVRARLYVYAADDGPHLAWQVRLQTDLERDDLYGYDPAAPLLFVDAHSGEVLAAWDDLNRSAASGRGISTFYGFQFFDASTDGTNYYLEDVGRHVGVFDNANRTSSASRYSDADGMYTDSAQRPGVDAIVGLQYTWDWYLDTQGVTGMNGSGGYTNQSAADGSGGLITARVRYGNRYNNAFWSGSYMAFGSGDGRQFASFTAIDVVAHEYTHGVTQYWCNLTYSNESGALNEAMSDIFGTMVEWSAADAGVTTGDYWVGEDMTTPRVAGDAMRYMDNPHQAQNYGYTADDDPDHYSERYTGRSDSGGVHINSGIVNHMFYLLSEGGSHHLGGTMTTGIGRDAAAQITFLALADYMTASSNFAAARQAMINAAEELYGAGSTEAIAVDEAWALVGVS